MRLHRFILGVTDPKVYVDHIDGNGLNCCRSNLRFSDAITNPRNRGKHATTAPVASGYKGVCWSAERGMWRAAITYDLQQHRLGFFPSEAEAARAYDAEAAKRFGPFARLNFATTGEPDRPVSVQVQINSVQVQD